MEWEEINGEESELHTASSSRGSSYDYPDDESIWFPQELQDIIIEQGGTLRDDMPVLSLADAAKLAELTEYDAKTETKPTATSLIKKDLRTSRHVGVSAIYENEERAIFICFTTKDNIYYFDAEDKKQISFVARQLYSKRSGVQFYFANGAIISHLLEFHSGIKLRNENILSKYQICYFSDQVNRVDLVSLDLYLSVKENLSEQTLNNEFSLKFIFEKVKPKELGYEELLVKYFPSIRVARLDLSYSREDLKQIKNSPDISQLGRNIIKKRAAPMRSLALAMLQKYNKQKGTPSQQIFLSAKMDSPVKEEFDRVCITDNNGKIEYRRHLCGFNKKFPIVD